MEGKRTGCHGPLTLSGKLLQQHDDDCDDEPDPISRCQISFPETQTSPHVLLFLDGGLNFEHLVYDVGVVSWEGSVIGQIFETFF